MQLRAKTAKGLAFESAKVGLKALVSLINVAVLARLLSPEMFGLMSLSVALLTGLETLGQVGSDRYLIQKRQLDRGLVGCAWVLGIGRGALICALTLLVAPLYAGVMRAPAAMEVLNVVAFVGLVRALKTPCAFLAERELNYFKVGLYEVLAAVIDAAVTIGLALLLRDVRALAWGMVCSTAVNVLLSYAMFGWRFTISLKWKSFRELIGVGKHFIIIAIGSYLMILGDNLIVGWLLGSTMLGYYVIAYKLVDLPLRLTFQITNRVAFSSLSRLQETPERMRAGFLELLDLQAAILFPLIAFVVVLAEPIVVSLYGAKWEPSVPVVRALGLIMLGRGISHIMVPFLMANGIYRLISKVKVIETVTFILGVLIGCRFWGLVGVALGGGIGYTLAGAIRIWYVINKCQIKADDLARHLAPVGLMLIIPVVLVILGDGMMNAKPILRLILWTIVFSFSYGGLTIIARPSLIRRIAETVQVFRRPSPISSLAVPE